MPNWIYNRLQIRGSAKSLKTIRDMMKTKAKDKETGEDYIRVFDFNKLIPMPESLDLISGTFTSEAVIIYLTDGLNIDVNNPAESEKAKQIQESWKKYAQMCIEFRAISVQEAYTCAKHAYNNPESEMFKHAYLKGKQYVDNMEKYGCPTWYEWRNREWGTQWNAVDASLEEKRGELTYHFKTANGVPEPVIEKLADMFPDNLIIHNWEGEGPYGSTHSQVYNADTYEINRLTRFLEKSPENDLEKIIKAFIDNDKIKPFYVLDDEGNADTSNRLFMNTGLAENMVIEQIGQTVPGVRVSLKIGTYCTTDNSWPGFWVDIEEKEEPVC